MRCNRPTLTAIHFSVVFILSLTPAAVFADMVFMRDGRILIGRIESQSVTTISLVTEEGRQVISKGNILRVEFGDPVKQTEERKQRLARDAEIARQRAESQRRAEEKKKAEAEALRLAEEKKRAERLAREAAEEAERQRAIEEARRIEEEQRKAAEESRRLEESKAAVDQSIEKLEEVNEIKSSVLTIRTGPYAMESAVVRNGSRLPYVADANRIIKGGLSFHAVLDPGAVKLPFTAFRELRYEIHRHRSRTGWVHTFGYLDAELPSYSVVGQENSTGSVFNGVTNLPYTSRVDSIEIKETPGLRMAEYNLLWKLYPFTQNYLDHLHLLIGGGITASQMDAKSGLRQTTTTGSLDPSTINPLFPAHGTQFRKSSTEYSEAAGYVHLGVGYVYPFLDIHALDVSIIASAGKGYGYLNHEEKAFMDVSGTPLISESHVRGKSGMNARRLDLETGYAITIYDIRIRIFAHMRQEYLTISSSEMRTGNGLEKMNAALNLASGGQPDLTPFLLEKLKNPAPYPEAKGYIRGIGIEAGVVF
jgi:hypothetical protein